jgi:bifunctional N-acetylglutamate synthase/kinase
VVIPAAPVAPADVVLTFLESLGRRSEAELYLKLFRKLPKESFAIIAPGAPVVRNALGSLVEELKFLADLDLFAPVLLGLYDPESAPASSERLVKRLPAAGLDACPHAMDEADLAERVREELHAERIPILHFPASDDSTLEQRLALVGGLVQKLETRKFVLLRRRGGLGRRERSSMNGRLSVINLRTDYQNLLAAKAMPKRDLELLETARQLIDLTAPLPLLVSVTSPLNLLKELFTVKGAGTLVKRGAQVERHDGYQSLDVERLKALFEQSFGKLLNSQFFGEAPLAVYLDVEYRGAAVITPGPSAPYLSKFAVSPEAQGEGIGNDLWQAMQRDFPALYWRTRADNPIAAWYQGVCDGMVRRKPWHVFWRGLEPRLIPDLVADAEARPADFQAPDPAPTPAPPIAG